MSREASIPIERAEFPHIDAVELLIEKHFKSRDGLSFGMDVEAGLYTIEMPSGKVLSFPAFWLEDLPEEGPGRIDFYLSMQAQYGR
ncbi:MAG: hypothetical protein HY315_05050 [Acidobacteria bacterium]|nr:hypothetical protein [Acidobacteriota bacterium]